MDKKDKQKPDEEKRVVLKVDPNQPATLAILSQLNDKSEEYKKQFLEQHRPLIESLQKLAETVAPTIKKIVEFNQEAFEKRKRMEELAESIFSREQPQLIYNPRPIPIASRVDINYKKLADAIIEGTLAAEEKKRQAETEHKIILLLTSDGDLYMKLDSTRRCHFGKSTNLYKLLLFLAKHSGYQPTQVVQADLKGGSARSLEFAMNGVNETSQSNGKPKKTLGLEFDLIEADRVSGYRINPLYKVIPIN